MYESEEYLLREMHVEACTELHAYRSHHSDSKDSKRLMKGETVSVAFSEPCDDCMETLSASFFQELCEELFILAQQSYIEDVWGSIIYDPLTVQEFCLIGDPSLRVGGYEQ
jgi:hypothetical protein